MRINKVTTKTGDKGQTRLGDGTKTGKDDLRIRCLGGVDELNSQIGLSAVAAKPPSVRTELEFIQNNLMNLSGELSIPAKPPTLITQDNISFLESRITVMNEQLPPLKEFILPGGNEFSARLHVARTICRRVESQVVELSQSQLINPDILRYLNRLSDYLFVLARFIGLENGVKESFWEHS